MAHTNYLEAPYFAEAGVYSQGFQGELQGSCFFLQHSCCIALPSSLQGPWDSVLGSSRSGGVVWKDELLSPRVAVGFALPRGRGKVKLGDVSTSPQNPKQNKLM